MSQYPYHNDPQQQPKQYQDYSQYNNDSQQPPGQYYDYSQSSYQTPPVQPNPQQNMYQPPLVQRQAYSRQALTAFIGGGIALVGFYMFPYYASYTGHELASVYGMYWLEVVLSIVSLVVTAVLAYDPLLRQISLAPAKSVMNSLESLRRKWIFGLIALGTAGVLVHYLFLNNVAYSPTYWGVGAWLYCLGMIAVAVGGVQFLLTRKL